MMRYLIYEICELIYEIYDLIYEILYNMIHKTTKPVTSRTGIFVAIANNTLHGSKLSIFFMPKIIRILSKDHVP